MTKQMTKQEYVAFLQALAYRVECVAVEYITLSRSKCEYSFMNTTSFKCSKKCVAM